MGVVPLELSARGRSASAVEGELVLETLGSEGEADPSTWPLLRAVPDSHAVAPGTCLGPYRLLRVLGRGGMGVVYLAYEAPPIQRLVAVKVLRSTSGSRRLRKRLETEVRALARLSHPNIAQVFAAGHTAEGSPYFALEYVPGLRIDEYCNQERLTLEQRLRLFLQLCGGVRYAHDRGVLHRDLKPSNVLVTEISGRPLVKIIDFSIAASLVPSDEHSATTGVAGTPGYMSPEVRRARESTADPRSDVYSLGVVLYQLLSGLRPFPREEGSPDGSPKKPKREVPPPPSRRVAALPLVARENLAEKRQQEKPRQLAKQLAGDLDAIVLRAMDPVRSSRYASVQELTEDIHRHLTAEPIRARRLTWSYRSSCFGRRNRRRLVPSLALVAGLLLTAGLGQRFHELQQAAQAARTRVDAERRAGELLEELLIGGDGPLGIQPTRQALQAARRRAEALTEEPVAQARLFQILGRASHASRAYGDAAELLEAALRIQESELGPESLAAADTASDLCRLYSDQARYSRAIEICERSLVLRRSRLGDDDPRVADTLGLLAYAKEREGSLSEALELHREAVALRRNYAADMPEALVEALSAQAAFHHRQGQLQAAQGLLEEALRLRIERHGSEDPTTVAGREALADVYAAQGQLENARLGYLHGLQVLERAGGGQEMQRARLFERIARLDLIAHRDQDAVRHASRALDLLEDSLAPSHPTVAEGRVLLARVLLQTGDDEAASAQAESALAAYEATFGAHPPEAALAELTAGDIAAARGQLASARRHYENALAPLRQLQPRSVETARALSHLGSALRLQGQPTEARRLQQEALSILEALQGLPQLEAAAVLRELGRLSRDDGDEAEARRFLERALMLRSEFVGPADPEVRALRDELAPLAGDAHLAAS